MLGREVLGRGEIAGLMLEGCDAGIGLLHCCHRPVGTGLRFLFGPLQLGMARFDVEASNQIIDTLTEWNSFLEAQNLLKPPVPPCP